MANYDYYGPPSPSPPPPEGHTYQQQPANISDLLRQLRRRANDGPADGHSRDRQQQQVQVISSDPLQLVVPIKDADGTTIPTVVVICNKLRRHRDAAYPRQPTTTVTPYHRPERWSNWSNRRRRRSPAPHDDDDDDKGATKVVCLAKMLSPGDRLEDDGFYQDFLEDVTEEAHKFGDLVKVVIPRPGPVVERGGAACVVAGVGKVFVEFRHLDDAAWCRRRLDGRWYGENEIAATFFSHDRFAAGDYA
uniref:Uncharacterized protein n=1 Tax=Avena sativa TaxID=4498 RepID=A0ACD5XYT4_AVESA